MNSGEFKIGVLGNTPMVDALKGMALSKKSTNNMPMVVKHYKSSSEIENCHILFVSNDQIKNFSSVLSNSNTKTTLILTDKPGMAKNGSSINFIEKDGKIRFELNMSNAQSKGLKVSSSLANLAIVI